MIVIAPLVRLEHVTPFGGVDLGVLVVGILGSSFFAKLHEEQKGVVVLRFEIVLGEAEVLAELIGRKFVHVRGGNHPGGGGVSFAGKDGPCFAANEDEDEEDHQNG